MVARARDAITPAPGSFVDRMIAKSPGTVLDPSLYGQPLTIVLRHTIFNSTATVEFDNIRLDAARIAPLLNADFDENGSVGGSDLVKWKAGFGGVGEAALHILGNANGDGFVDGADLLGWRRQLGILGGAAAAAAGACLFKRNRCFDV
jgi:hypothetical protein